MRLPRDRTVTLAAALAILAVAAGGAGVWRLTAARQALDHLEDDLPTAAWSAELVRAVGSTALSGVAAMEIPNAANHTRFVDSLAALRRLVETVPNDQDRADLAQDVAEWANPLEDLDQAILDRSGDEVRDQARTEHLLTLADTAADNGDAPAQRAIARLLAVNAAPETDAVEWHRSAFAGALEAAPGDGTPLEGVVRTVGMEADNAFSARLNALHDTSARVETLEAARERLSRLVDSARRISGERAKTLAARKDGAAGVFDQGLALSVASIPLFLLSLGVAMSPRRRNAIRRDEPAAVETRVFSPADLVEEIARRLTGEGDRIVAEVAPGVPERVTGDPTRLGEVLRTLASGTGVLRVALCEEPGADRAILRFESEPADTVPDDAVFAGQIAALGGRTGVSRRDGGVSRRWLIAAFPVTAPAEPETALAGRPVIVEAGDPGERDALARTLEAAGAVVRVTANADETNELLEADPADCVVAVAGNTLGVRPVGGGGNGKTLPLTAGRKALWAAVAGVADENGEPVLDRAFVAETFGAETASMLGFFLETTADPVRALADGRTQGSSAIRTAAHRAAGAARTAGAKRLAAALSALEQAAVMDDEAAFPALRARIGRELALVEAEIAAFDRPKAPDA